MQPHQALSPVSRLRNLQVLYISPCTTWSVAKFKWLDDGGNYDNPSDWSDAIGLRWNGDLNNANDKGHPRSHAQGTWFILPDGLADIVRAMIPFMKGTVITQPGAQNAT